MRSLFKVALFSAMVYTMVSCSEKTIDADLHELENTVIARAGNDIFNVTKIDDDDFWYDAYKTVDNEGNFYFISACGYNPSYIMKYDNQKNEVSTFFPIEIDEGNGYFFCCDNNNNFCHIANDLNVNRLMLKRIKSDGSSVINQTLDFPFEVSRILGMCAAANGNIFILVPNQESAFVYRISTNGVLTDMGIEIPDRVPSSTAFGYELHKASGAILYMARWFSDPILQINTNTGVVEALDLRFSMNVYGTAAGTGQSNLFALDGYNIIKVRPNAATDYHVGTIPSQYRNTDGQIVDFPTPYELYMNSDATIFYVVTGYGLYKLTL